MNELQFATKCIMREVKTIRKSLSVLAFAMTICSPVRVLHAQPAEGRGMHDMNGGWMSGWAGGGMWLWVVIGVLVAALLVVAIVKLTRK